MTDFRRHFGIFILGSLIAVIPFVATFAMLFAAPPLRAGEPVLVIAPPWGEGPAKLAVAAGGKLISPIDAPFGSVATFDTEPPVDRLMAMGAWAVGDGKIAQFFCAR